MNFILLSVCITLSVFVATYRAQSAGLSKDALDNSKKYLKNYGYIDSFNVNEEKLKAGIIRLQHFANLKQTGVLDAATLKQMTIPRCGLEDPKIKIKTRRYVHQGSRWRKQKLTWRLAGRGRTLGREQIRRVFIKALGFWQDITNIDFTETSSQEPDIWVRFVRYNHGDPYSFDGQGGTLAHAFYPHNNRGLSGDVHFDDDEDYTVESPHGRNLLWVATHELGHSLGLDHSNVQEAVMYPWYTKYKPGFKLNYDDVVGIQSLYGSRQTKQITTTTTTTTRRTTTTTTPKPVINKRSCPRSIAAVYFISYANMEVLLTDSGKLYFVNRQGGIRYGPIRAANYYPKNRIPDPITAAFNTKVINNRDMSIIFAGKYYYVYQYFRYRSGPHSIHGRSGKNPLNLKFPTWVNKVDAAMTWYRNKRTYFFAGAYYWRYNNERKEFDSGYPRRIRDAWKGVPSPVDAAYSSAKDKKTFFVSGNRYYLLNDRYVKVERNYPEHIGRRWLDCGGDSALKKMGGLTAGGLSGTDDKYGKDP